MKFPIGAMSVGDILDRGLKLLLARLPDFYLINLIVSAPLIIFQLALPLLVLEKGAAPSSVLIGGAIIGGLAVFALTVILQPIGTASILYLITQEFVDQRATVGEAFRFALHRFGRLLGTSILAGLAIVLGIMCCVIPGFLFLVWYIFIGQVVVVEGLGSAAALSRSKSLGQGYYWRIFGVIILLFIVQFIIDRAAGMLELVLPSHESVPGQMDQTVSVLKYGNFAIQTIVKQLAGILVGTYGAICWTLFYFDLRIRKEGFDLELAAQKQTRAIG